jgi:hypothetical protein
VRNALRRSNERKVPCGFGHFAGAAKRTLRRVVS